jgi:hypothetical protein
MRRTGSTSGDVLSDGVVALLYRVLETAMGAEQVYQAALPCAIHPELRDQWSRHLIDTERHVAIARGVLRAAGLDPDAQLPVRIADRHLARGRVGAMREALACGPPSQAQITAAECMVEAETHAQRHWSFIKLLARETTGALGEVLRAACAEVVPQADRHLHHTFGWTEVLWAEAMGLAVFVPPFDRDEGERVAT